MIDHKEGIKNSIAVDNHLVTQFGDRVENRHAKNWCLFPHLVIGSKDLRARKGSFTTPWQGLYDDMYPMPELKFVDYRLSDLLDQRAIELMALAEEKNKKLAVMWSGGIDSTSVLVSFLKNARKSDLQNIVVLLTSESIIEHFDFYRRFISGKLRCMHLTEFDMCNDVLEKYMLIHGDPGDCIYGPTSIAFKEILAEGKHTRPWKTHIHYVSEFFLKDQGHYRGGHQFANWYVRRATNNLTEVAPENVTDISDWWWWHYFNFKWATAIVRPFMHLRKNPKEPIDRQHRLDYANYTYFNSDAFQQWSYSNLKNHFKFYGQGKKGIKWEAKNYIYEFDKNDDYRDSKIKIASKSPDFDRRAIEVFPIYYDQDWVGYYTWEPGVSKTILDMLESFKG